MVCEFCNVNPLVKAKKLGFIRFLQFCNVNPLVKSKKLGFIRFWHFWDPRITGCEKVIGFVMKSNQRCNDLPQIWTKGIFGIEMSLFHLRCRKVDFWDPEIALSPETNAK